MASAAALCLAPAQAAPCTVATGTANAVDCGSGIWMNQGSVWRVAGGTVGFSVTLPSSAIVPRVAASVRFRKQPWSDAEVRLVRTEPTGPTYVYEAVIPADLESDRNAWIVARTGLLARTAEAQVAILGPSGAPVAVAVREIGIVKPWEAAVLALLAATALLFLARVIARTVRRLRPRAAAGAVSKGSLS